MKSILISIKPQWVAKILNGEKTVEIRKTKPKCELPIDVYIYCTKGPYMGHISKEYVGKVVARFTLNEVEEISWQMGVYELEQQWFSDFLDKCCLGFSELKNYLDRKNGYAWHISDLVIFDEPKELSKLITKKSREAYQRNLELAYKADKRIEKRIHQGLCYEWEIANNSELTEMSKSLYGLRKAPQSWCYVDEMED